MRIRGSRKIKACIYNSLCKYLYEENKVCKSHKEIKRTLHFLHYKALHACSLSRITLIKKNIFPSPLIKTVSLECRCRYYTIYVRNSQEQSQLGKLHAKYTELKRNDKLITQTVNYVLPCAHNNNNNSGGASAEKFHETGILITFIT